MKLRVIFLKKKHIYYAVLSLLILILLVVYVSSKKTATTFNTLVDNSKLIKEDLNGDGKEDFLYIKTEQNKYYIEVNTGDKSYFLEPDKKLPTNGLYYANNPLKVTLMDITRDKVPEIFVQAFDKAKSVQHVFIWKEDKFVDIYCSSNSIFGFSDSSNNRTPKFFSGNLNGVKIDLLSYIFMPDKNGLESFLANTKSNHMGKDTIASFVKYIELLPGSEVNKPANIFYPGLSGQDLSIVGKLSGENNTYKLQNCVFKDNRSDKKGEISEILWTLNFKAVSNINRNNIKTYKLTVLLKANGAQEEPNYYKIASIKLD